MGGEQFTNKWYDESIKVIMMIINFFIITAIRVRFIGKFSIISSLLTLLKSPSAHIIFTSSDILKNLMRKGIIINYN